MPLGVAEKIIAAHLVQGRLIPGEEIGLKIDQTLTQDATGTIVYLQFESMDRESHARRVASVATELSVSYVDHNTIQDGSENADDHRYLQSVAERYGIVFSKAGNGICHQVHLERFSAPGKSLLGADSHTPTCGGAGMLAIGAGGGDVTLALAGYPFFVECPRIIRINLRNRLPPFSSAKDVILTILGKLTTKGNTGMLIEYGGEGLTSLSVPERATIANMGAELGVTTSIFPSDQVTLAFLKAQGRAKVWQEILPDEGAHYERVIDLDLATVVPMIARPPSPDNVCPVKEIAGLAVDQVAIGSCTNSSYTDLMRVAALLTGRRVHPRVSLVIAPGSRQVLQMVAENGAFAPFVAAGARIQEPVCGFCIGNCHAPPTNGVSLRTINRNFKGRSGTPSASVYLVSPETAVVAAIRGVVTDPREAGWEYPVVAAPKALVVDDSMILPPPPPAERRKVEIVRGPNIGAPLELEGLADCIAGIVAIKVGDKITTDDIMPAGARLKYRSNIPKYAEFVFEQIDPAFSRRCREYKEIGKDAIIVAGESYAQGSSREHAALCPRYLGVKAVLAISFERIHFANLINYGIVPLVLKAKADYEALQPGDNLELRGLKQAIAHEQETLVVNKTRPTACRVELHLSDRQRVVLLAGGVFNYAAAHSAQERPNSGPGRVAKSKQRVDQSTNSD
ncbi:MAG: aconitate hydratase [Lentisphaerae bacterium]|nr:aconitate hydratase [Lentisphaerota bacterium]